MTVLDTVAEPLIVHGLAKRPKDVRDKVVSLLETVGLPQLVTHSLEEYEALALALARDPARLAALKTRLAGNRLSSPLYDIDRMQPPRDHGG